MVTLIATVTQVVVDACSLSLANGWMAMPNVACAGCVGIYQSLAFRGLGCRSGRSRLSCSSIYASTDYRPPSIMNSDAAAVDGPWMQRILSRELEKLFTVAESSASSWSVETSVASFSVPGPFEDYVPPTQHAFRLTLS
jgi:hypothetical protein